MQTAPMCAIGARKVRSQLLLEHQFAVIASPVSFLRQSERTVLRHAVLAGAGPILRPERLLV